MTKPDLHCAARDVLAAFDLAELERFPETRLAVLADTMPPLRAALAHPLTPEQLRQAGDIDGADAASAKLVDDTAGRIVGSDVNMCVSWLVSELMKQAHSPGAIMTEEEAETLTGRGPDVDDYRDQLPSGYTVEKGVDPSDGAPAWRWFGDDIGGPDLEDSDWHETELEALKDLYEAENLDQPDGCEAMEHWAVSSWLAEKLKAKGESVALTDWAGPVWARCTSGQMVRMDWVFQQIARDLCARELTGVDSND